MLECGDGWSEMRCAISSSPVVHTYEHGMRPGLRNRVWLTDRLTSCPLRYIGDKTVLGDYRSRPLRRELDTGCIGGRLEQITKGQLQPALNIL